MTDTVPGSGQTVLPTQRRSRPTPPSRCGVMPIGSPLAGTSRTSRKAPAALGRRIDATGQSLDQLFVSARCQACTNLRAGRTAGSAARVAAKSAAAALRRYRDFYRPQEAWPFASRDARSRERRAAHRDRGGCLPAGYRLGIERRRDQDLYRPGAAIRCTRAGGTMGPGFGSQIPAAGRDHHAGELR